MNGIFYFSSTGNSLDIAQKIQKVIGGEVHYIPKFRGSVGRYKKIVIVSPVYSGGLPIHTEHFLRAVKTQKPCYIILNYGGMALGAPYYAYKTAVDSSINISGIYTVKMPENYTLQFTQPGWLIRLVLKKSEAKIKKIAQYIADDAEYLPKKPLIDSEGFYYKNRENWHLIAHDFTVGGNCTHCGKCISVCPAHNIVKRNGKICFKDSCVACLGCYHRCPVKAINYQGKTAGKPRYINPNIKENNITS